jgi:hypothetical protein
MDFEHIVVCDFEFCAPDGCRPAPHCGVFHELNSDRTLRMGFGDWKTGPPWPTDKRSSLWVAYYSPAELSCFAALGWPFPWNICDLYAEYRVLTNGDPWYNSRRKLTDALQWAKLDPIDSAYKDAMRDVAIRGAPFTEEEKRDLLIYCEGDVLSTAGLFRKMQARIDPHQMLLRGRYLRAIGGLEARGIPIDVGSYDRLMRHWDGIKLELISEVDRDYGVYEGTRFRQNKWADWLNANDIPWPRLLSGKLDLKSETFREVSDAYPEVRPIYELRTSLAELRLNNLTIGPDGRNRFMSSPFGSKSGRNTPSTSKSVFGPSRWIRSLIKPDPNRALAYVDWSSQEIGIAAALSGDQRMLDAYLDGDFYLATAKLAGAVPPDATKISHAKERHLFKTVCLGVQYGMGSRGLADRLGTSLFQARELLGMHRAVYPTFWRWSDSLIDNAYDASSIHTVHGWRMYTGTGGQTHELTLRNWPMQSNGGDMLRLACAYAHEAGIGLVATVHDAVMIESEISDLDDAVKTMQRCMADASDNVLKGVRLKSGVEAVKYPDRYMDERGATMWSRVNAVVNRLEAN